MSGHGHPADAAHAGRAATTTARLQDALAVACAVYLVLLQTNLALALRSVAFGVIAALALVLVTRADVRGNAALSPPARWLAFAFLAWAAWSAASLGWSRAPGATAPPCRARRRASRAPARARR